MYYKVTGLNNKKLLSMKYLTTKELIYDLSQVLTASTTDILQLATLLSKVNIAKVSDGKTKIRNLTAKEVKTITELSQIFLDNFGGIFQELQALHQKYRK